MLSPAQRPPAVDKVLAWAEIAALVADHGRPLVLAAVRDELAARRSNGAALDRASLAAALAARLRQLLAPSLRPVLNLSGTVLHTNLGRAVLPAEAIARLQQVARGGCNLEFDLDQGGRGDRDDHVQAWLRRLSGAEAAAVVNNNAAALLLILASLAGGRQRREVIVSRGELVEIGGAFRLPEIMAQAGCRLREVGTTNRTHLADYAEAITPNTALLLKVHTSNYRIEGFTASVAESALAGLCRAHGLPLVVDLGSGALIDLAGLGLPAEPTVAATLASGADLVCFSGDKLLGGPQAGLIVGRAELVARLQKNPLKRALRCDKLSLAALEAVLALYADPERLPQRLPTLRLLTRPLAEIDALARRLQPTLAAWWGDAGRVDVVACDSQIGSGAMPTELLPSAALRLTPAGPARHAGRALAALARRLRALPLPLVGRTAEGALWLDLRCLAAVGDGPAQAADEAAFVALFTQP